MKIIICFLLFVAGCVPAFSEEIAFTASAKKDVVVGEQFEVAFTLNAGGRAFVPPPFSDFNVLMGPSQSNSMQFINGNMSQSMSISYILQATKEGTFKIPSGSIEVNGKRIPSNQLTITVSKGNKPAAGGTQKGNNQAANESEDISKQVGDNILLRVSVDKSNVYQGEGVMATYKIYRRVDIIDLATSSPVNSGFWSQDIEMPKNIESHRENIDGVQYMVSDIKKVVLFPQRSGSITLDPMTCELIARVQVKRKRSRDPFDIFNDPFFGDPFFNNSYQDVRLKVKSNALKVTVKPLPTPAPEGFGGAVGKFSMEARLDKATTKTNEPVSIKIKLSGKGNMKLIESPKLSFPNDIESFDPKMTENISVNAAGVTGSKTVEYLLIPRHSGEYKIDPVKFAYFDLEKKSYVSISSPEFKIKVDKGNEPEAPVVASGVDKEDVQLLGKDIRFIKTNPLEFTKHEDSFYGSGIFYSLIASPFLLLLGLLAYRRKVEILNSDASLVKSRKATAVAKKRLSVANTFLIEKNREKFYEEVSKALWGYVSDKVTIPLAQLSKENVMEKLSKKQVSDATIQHLTSTIDHCDYARFAPPSGSDEMERTYQDTIGLITKLEEEIR